MADYAFGSNPPYESCRLMDRSRFASSIDPAFFGFIRPLPPPSFRGAPLGANSGDKSPAVTVIVVTVTAASLNHRAPGCGMVRSTTRKMK